MPIIYRSAIGSTRRKHPLQIHGWVVLPDHVHCVISLPPGDADFVTRWRLVKLLFSRAIPTDNWRNPSRQQSGERGIWQRRYWEHLIRDEAYFAAHMHYVHINPLKHGLVKQVRDWPYSTFHRLISDGVYPADWEGGADDVHGYDD